MIFFFGLETILRYHHIITTEVEYYTHTYIILVAAGWYCDIVIRIVASDAFLSTVKSNA